MVKKDGKAPIKNEADNGVSKAGVVTLLSSPYRHWRTVFEFSGQRTIEPDPDDEEAIPLSD